MIEALDLSSTFSLHQAINSQYVADDPGSIQAYLQQRQDLDLFLREASSIIQHYFGADTKPRLEIVAFPDSECSRLYIHIPTNKSPEEALEKLFQIDEECNKPGRGSVCQDATFIMEYI